MFIDSLFLDFYKYIEVILFLRPKSKKLINPGKSYFSKLLRINIKILRTILNI